MTLRERDHAAIWHPLTQHQMTPPAIPIVRGEGTYLVDEQGNRYLDLISSWWVNIHGHAHPAIANAIHEQALKLEQVIFSGFTHEPAIELAEILLALLGKPFSKVFYSDNGSTAVEVALKMSYQYWHNQGQVQRKRFMSFREGYHGDTFGAMSVGQDSVYFKSFSDLLFPVALFDYPTTWLDDGMVWEKEKKSLTDIAAYLEQYAAETVAMILEPLVQGAAGMRMCRPEFLQQLVALLKLHDVLVIYDEIMTGFGRTGELFAFKKSETAPDIICLSKGLTGGFLPLSVTVCHEKIYDAFLGNDFSRALAHSHSFTANPLGCAAALASMALLKHPDTQTKIAQIEAVHRVILSQRKHEKGRFCGTIAAFELPLTAAYGSQTSVQLRDCFLKRGLLIRPIGSVIYLLPPYCVTETELRHAYDTIDDIIEGYMYDI